MKNFLKIIFILSVLFLQNCSDDETYDKKKAVSALVKSDSLNVDKNLENIKISLPNQIKNQNFGIETRGENYLIENFYFAPKPAKSASKQKFINNSVQIWSGYRSAFPDRFVFEPIIKDKKIFLLDAKGILAVYDLSNSKKIWENRIFARRYLKNYQSPRIGYFDNKIFAIAGANEIKAVSAEDGKILWSKTIASLPISKPIADEKFVYVTTNDDKTYALNTNNGELAWVASGVAKPTAIFGAAKPIIYNNLILVSYASGEIYALNKNNGEVQWSQSLNINRATDSDFYLNDIDSTPIIKNDVVFAVGNGGLMMAINVKNGNYLWKKEIAAIADFWALGDFLFIIDNSDQLICLSQKNGAIKYVSQLPDFKNKNKPQTKIIYNGLIAAGDKLIISDSRGRLIIANPQDGKIEQNFSTNQNIFHSPIIVDGKIYLHSVGKYTINLVEIW